MIKFKNTISLVYRLLNLTPKFNKFKFNKPNAAMVILVTPGKIGYLNFLYFTFLTFKKHLRIGLNTFVISYFINC